MSLFKLPVELQLQVYYALDLTSVLNLSATSSHFKAVYDSNRALIVKQTIPAALENLVKLTRTDPASFVAKAANLERKATDLVERFWDYGFHGLKKTLVENVPGKLWTINR